MNCKLNEKKNTEKENKNQTPATCVLLAKATNSVDNLCLTPFSIQPMGFRHMLCRTQAVYPTNERQAGHMETLWKHLALSSAPQAHHLLWENQS